MFIPLAPCANNVSWDLSKDKLDKTIELDGYYLSTSYDFTMIEVSSPTHTFIKDKIDKDYIIVKASKKDEKAKDTDEEDPYIHSVDELFSNRIEPSSIVLSDNVKLLFI